MENYKVRVDNEAESKEAQELFFELGFKWVNEDEGVYWETPTCFIFAKSRTKTLFSFSSDQDVVLVELTIPQLKDLVVLKRNTVSDCTHRTNDGNTVYYEDSLGQLYFHNMYGKWQKSVIRVDCLKPIEKTMKEYINKTTGEYLKTADVVTGEQWIEVPEGAAILSEFDGGEKENYFAFYKQGKDRLMCCYPKELEWCSTGWLNLEGFLFERKDSMRVVWQRHTKPEHPKGTELVIQDKGGNIRYFRNGCGYEFFSDACWHGVSIPFAVLEESKILWLKEGCQAFWDVQRTKTLPSPFNFVADSKQPEALPFADDEPTLDKLKIKVNSDLEKAIEIAQSEGYQNCQFNKIPQDAYWLLCNEDGTVDYSMNENILNEYALLHVEPSLNDTHTEIEQVRQSIKSDGGSSEYHQRKIPKKMLKRWKKSGVIEVKDVIRLFLNNDFTRGNIFKAHSRISSLENGLGKSGASKEYDLNKVLYFAQDDVKANK